MKKYTIACSLFFSQTVNLTNVSIDRHLNDFSRLFCARLKLYARPSVRDGGFVCWCVYKHALGVSRKKKCCHTWQWPALIAALITHVARYIFRRSRRACKCDNSFANVAVCDPAKTWNLQIYTRESIWLWLLHSPHFLSRESSASRTSWCPRQCRLKLHVFMQSAGC